MTQVSVFLCDNKSSEFTVPVDGSVLFVIDQFFIDTPADPVTGVKVIPSTITMDLSSIPTLNLSTGNTLAFLMCSPHVSIETRQVRATGNGNLTLGKTLQRLGNIDFYQANYLLSNALYMLATNSGPTTLPGQLGTDLIEWFIFGGVPSLIDDSPPDGYPPAPLTHITAAYKQIIQSATKPILSGQIATVNATGGNIVDQMVFTSSLGHVYTSAAFFAFLMIALVAAQFRKKRAAFTFVNVAAALADSDVPQKCVEMTQFKMGTDSDERKVLKLVPSGDGQLNCAYQSTDNVAENDMVNFRLPTLDFLPFSI
jgi:hypothetical protein